MSILFVTSKSLGGSGKYISALAGGIKHDIACDIIYYPSSVSQDAEFEAEFKRTFHFEKAPKLNPLGLVNNIRQIRRLLRGGEYTAIHTHTSLGGLVGRVAAFLSGSQVRVLHTIHAYGADEFTPVPQKWFYWLIEKALDSMTDRYISPSKYMLEYGARMRLINAEKASVIYNSLPIVAPGAERRQQRTGVRAALGLPSEEVVFLFCGRLERQKGIDILLQAVALVSSTIPFRLVLCGAGDMSEQLLEMASALGIQDRLAWLGWQSEVSQYYAAADVYIMPSRWESFGLVFLEAMNYRLPILSTRTQAVPEVVEDNGAGLLSQNENARALAENMDRLLADAPLRAKLGARGNEILHERFSFDGFIDAHLALYRRCGVKFTAQPVADAVRRIDAK